MDFLQIGIEGIYEFQGRSELFLLQQARKLAIVLGEVLPFGFQRETLGLYLRSCIGNRSQFFPHSGEICVGLLTLLRASPFGIETYKAHLESTVPKLKRS